MMKRDFLVAVAALALATPACSKLTGGGDTKGSGSGSGSGSGAVAGADIKVAGNIALDGFKLADSTSTYAVFVTKLDVDIADADKTKTVLADAKGDFADSLSVPETKKNITVSMVVQEIPATGTPKLLCQVFVAPAKAGDPKQPSVTLAAGKNLAFDVTKDAKTGSCAAAIRAESDALNYEEKPDLQPVKAGSLAGAWGAREVEADKSYYTSTDDAKVSEAVQDAGDVAYSDDGGKIDFGAKGKYARQSALTDTKVQDSAALQKFDQFYYFTETLDADNNVVKVQQYDLNARKLCYEGDKFAARFFGGAADKTGTPLLTVLGDAAKYNAMLEAGIRAEVVAAGIATAAAFDAALLAIVNAEYTRIHADKTTDHFDNVTEAVAKSLIKNGVLASIRRFSDYAPKDQASTPANDVCADIVKDGTNKDGRVDAGADLICKKLLTGTAAAFAAKVAAFAASEFDGVNRSCDTGSFVDLRVKAGHEKDAKPLKELAIFCNGGACVDGGKYLGTQPGFMGEYDVMPGPKGVFSLYSSTEAKQNISVADVAGATAASQSNLVDPPIAVPVTGSGTGSEDAPVDAPVDAPADDSTCKISEEHSRTLFTTLEGDAFMVNLTDNGYNNCNQASTSSEAVGGTLPPSIGGGDAETTVASKTGDEVTGEDASSAVSPDGAPPAGATDFTNPGKLFGAGQQENMNSDPNGYSFDHKQIWVRLNKAAK